MVEIKVKVSLHTGQLIGESVLVGHACMCPVERESGHVLTLYFTGQKALVIRVDKGVETVHVEVFKTEGLKGEVS